MLSTIVIQNRLFAEGDADDRADCEMLILWLLEIVTIRNMNYLRRHPETPKLYDSGVVYALPDQMREGKLSENKLDAIKKYLAAFGIDEETLDIVMSIIDGTEIFRDIPSIIDKGAVDCFPLSQKIIVRSKSTGCYELLSLAELRHMYPYYEALSYNFTKCDYEFKNIVGFVDKGVKAVSKARLSNGTDLVSTDSHKFWTLDGQNRKFSLETRTMGEYVENYTDKKSGKITKSKYGNRSRILQAAKIPALSNIHPSASEAYLAGMYAAEGYTRKPNRDAGVPTIGQHKPAVRQKIEFALSDLGIDYSYFPGRGKTPGSGAEYHLLGGKSQPRLEMFRNQGHNSFDKHLPQTFLSGDEASVATMLRGHADGDAWIPENGNYKRPGISAIYATSSDELMEQLRLGDLVLGRPTYAYRYENHQGSGNKPIWRLHEYDEKASKLAARAALVGDEMALPGLRYGTVRNAMPFGTAHVGCIEVEGNHNFFLADGTLVSNCDNLAVWRAAELRCVGIMASPYITWREVSNGTTYHALVRWPDGTSEDPSLLLGMQERKPGLRDEEKRKNLERFDNFIKAAQALAQAGKVPLAKSASDVASLGLIPMRGAWPA